jgi:hypothetical protein
VRIVSWDLAKYVNHCCDCNTMSTGYGFEIALRDIHPGEEITVEYGLFNIPEPMPLYCGCTHCRGLLTAADIDRYHATWDRAVQEALSRLESVSQPLWSLVPPEIAEAVRSYLHTRRDYRSVLTLKATPGPQIIEIGASLGAKQTYARRVH